MDITDDDEELSTEPCTGSSFANTKPTPASTNAGTAAFGAHLNLMARDRELASSANEEILPWRCLGEGCVASPSGGEVLPWRPWPPPPPRAEERASSAGMMASNGEVAAEEEEIRVRSLASDIVDLALDELGMLSRVTDARRGYLSDAHAAAAACPGGGCDVPPPPLGYRILRADPQFFSAVSFTAACVGSRSSACPSVHRPPVQLTLHSSTTAAGADHCVATTTTNSLTTSCCASTPTTVPQLWTSTTHSTCIYTNGAAAPDGLAQHHHHHSPSLQQLSAAKLSAHVRHVTLRDSALAVAESPYGPSQRGGRRGQVGRRVGCCAEAATPVMSSHQLRSIQQQQRVGSSGAGSSVGRGRSSYQRRYVCLHRLSPLKLSSSSSRRRARRTLASIREEAGGSGGPTSAASPANSSTRSKSMEDLQNGLEAATLSETTAVDPPAPAPAPTLTLTLSQNQIDTIASELRDLRF